MIGDYRAVAAGAVVGAGGSDSLGGNLVACGASVGGAPEVDGEFADLVGSFELLDSVAEGGTVGTAAGVGDGGGGGTVKVGSGVRDGMRMRAEVVADPRRTAMVAGANVEIACESVGSG